MPLILVIRPDYRLLYGVMAEIQFKFCLNVVANDLGILHMLRADAVKNPPRGPGCGRWGARIIRDIHTPVLGIPSTDDAAMSGI
jgi:hypothetical protein